MDDSESILELDALPRSLVVVGGGPVGCEYASLGAALGVEVTLIDAGDRLLPFVDAEISNLLATAFAGMGIRLVLGQGVARIGRQEGALVVSLADGETIRPERVLFAAGRAGNTQGLGLAEAGIEIDKRGRIVVDDRFQTSAQGMYAAGDVIGPPALASVETSFGEPLS